MQRITDKQNEIHCKKNVIQDSLYLMVCVINIYTSNRLGGISRRRQRLGCAPKAGVDSNEGNYLTIKKAPFISNHLNGIK